MSDELDDPLRRLHDQVVLGDPTAIESLARVLLDTLPRWLPCPRVRVDSDQAITAVVDAIVEYTARPDRFDPSRGVPLAQYIRAIAGRNLQDAVRSDRRRAAREARYAMELPPGDLPEAALSERLHQAARAICDDQEFEAFRLWLGGEHKVARLAAAIGLSHLPPGEQQRAVKRFRERTVRRLLRQLTPPGRRG